MSALAHLTVVEIGDDSGGYAGKLLVDLGARVVRVIIEPETMVGFAIDPDPYVQDFLHRSKETLALPADPREAVRLFEELVAGADILLESGPPDLLERIGVSAGAVSRPSLIRTRISPFGLDGEHALDPASDLTVSASSGFLSLGGWPDRAPTRAFGDQSWRMASLHAAVATLLAVIEEDTSGLGQQVDVSAQEAVATALENALQFYDLEGVVRTRIGAGYNEAGTGVYTCADGYVYLMVGRLSTAQGWANLLTWFDDVGLAGRDVLRDAVWSDHAYRQEPSAQAYFRELFERFAAGRDKSDLYVEAQQRGIAMSPINSLDDLLSSEQLNARNFFLKKNGSKLVGAPYRLSLTPWEMKPAPAQVTS